MQVLYDDNCLLCKTLAQFAKRYTDKNLSFEAWQTFQKRPETRAMFGEKIAQQPPDELRVFMNGTLWAGEAAWSLLLRHYPGLKSLSWLAKKMGLEKQTASLLHRGSKRIRTICRTCRGK